MGGYNETRRQLFLEYVSEHLPLQWVTYHDRPTPGTVLSLQPLRNCSPRKRRIRKSHINTVKEEPVLVRENHMAPLLVSINVPVTSWGVNWEAMPSHVNCGSPVCIMWQGRGISSKLGGLPCVDTLCGIPLPAWIPCVDPMTHTTCRKEDSAVEKQLLQPMIHQSINQSITHQMRQWSNQLINKNCLTTIYQIHV